MKTSKVLIATLLIACVVTMAFQTAYASNWDRMNHDKPTKYAMEKSGGGPNYSHGTDYIKRIAQNNYKICGLTICG